MKIIIFLFFFFIFIKIYFCKSQDEIYSNLLKKLEVLDELVLEGHHKFIVNKPDGSNNSKTKINYFISLLETFRFTSLQPLLDHIKSVINKTNGLDYLIESYDAFNYLIYMIHFYYDIYRVNFHNMCIDGSCKIPFYLKINENEINDIKTYILDYRKPLQDIKDDIQKLGVVIKSNEAIESKLKELIKTSENKISDLDRTVGDDAARVRNRKDMYQAQYNIIFYNKELREITALNGVLKTRVEQLKGNEAIKLLLIEIEKKKAQADSTDKNEQIAQLEAKVKDIAKNIEFNIDSMYTDPVVLSFYLEEKKNKLSKNKNETHEVISSLLSSDSSNDFYPDGFEHPLKENEIKDVLTKEDKQAPFGYLYNYKTLDIEKNIRAFNGENALKDYINDIKEGIVTEKNNLSTMKPTYTEKKELYDNMKIMYESKKIFYDNLKKYDSINDVTIKAFIYWRSNFFLSKFNYEQIKKNYEISKYNLKMLQQQLIYLEEYILRKDFHTIPINYFKKLKTSVEIQINNLEQKINQNEIKIGGDHDIYEVVDDLDNNTSLLLEKIEQLKTIENILTLEELKSKLYVPNDYKLDRIPEPYYLVAIKYEVDKFMDLIPKIKTMLDEEKQKLSKLKIPPTTIETNNTKISQVSNNVQIEGINSSLLENIQADTVVSGQEDASLTETSSESTVDLNVVSPPQIPGTQSSPQQVSDNVSNKQAPNLPVSTENVSDQLSNQQLPNQQLPTQQAPNQQAPTQQAPNQQAPTQQAPTQQAPNQQAPTQQAPNQQAPTQQAPNQQAPNQQAPNAENFEELVKKVKFLEKLLDFLNISYICNKKILLSNTTLRSNFINKYKFTNEESKKLSVCNKLDLIHSIQNNPQIIYSMYNKERRNLQYLYNEIHKREIIYNLYKLREIPQIKERLLNVLGLIPIQPQPQPSQNQQENENLRGANSHSSTENITDETEQSIRGNDETAVQVENTRETETVGKPLTTESTAAQPNATPPNAAPPNAAQPNAAQSNAAQSNATQPNTAQSNATQPNATQPAETSPPDVKPPAETSPPVVTPPSVVTPPPSETSPVVTPPVVTPPVVTPPVVTPPVVTPPSSETTEENGISGDHVQPVKTLDNSQENSNILDITDFEYRAYDEIFYKTFLLQNQTFDNDYLVNFINSEAKTLEGLNKQTEWIFLTEINNLKEELKLSYDNLKKYKLKLERLLLKTKEISDFKGLIRRNNNFRVLLQNRLNVINGNVQGLKKFNFTLQKCRENEKEEIQNLLEENSTLLKYYKSSIKYYTRESPPLINISNLTLEKEKNFRKLEDFNILSQVERIKKRNIVLEKKSLNYVSGTLHHILFELRKIIKKNDYTSESDNVYDEEFRNTINLYVELFPEISNEKEIESSDNNRSGEVSNTLNTTEIQGTVSASTTPAQPASTPAQPASTPAQPASTPAQPTSTPAQSASTSAQSASTTPAQSASTTPAQPASKPAQSASTSAQAASTTLAVPEANPSTENTSQPNSSTVNSSTLPVLDANGTVENGSEVSRTSQGENTSTLESTTQNPSNSSTAGSTTVDVSVDKGTNLEVSGQSENNELDNIINNNENNEYLKLIASTYKNLQSEAKRIIFILHRNIQSVLDSNIRKRKLFHEALNFDLIPFKTESSTNNYIVENPYKLLDKDKRNKILINYKYMLSSIAIDINFIDENNFYIIKLSEKYNTNLEQIKREIEANQSGTENTTVLLRKIKELYEYFLIKIAEVKNTFASRDSFFENEKMAIQKKIDLITNENEINRSIITLKKDKLAEENNFSKEIGSIISNIDQRTNWRRKFSHLNILDNAFINSIFINYLNQNIPTIYDYIQRHKCINTVCPQNSGCFRYLNGKEVCKCLLNFKKQGNECIHDENPTCEINNGGCDRNADCENGIRCVCRINNSYPIHGGIFCSYSNFLSLSFLLIIFFVLYNLF